MLTRKSIARTAAATAGLALVATGALAPASAAEGKGAERGQAQAAVAQAKSADKADRKSEKADRSKGRSATAPHGNAYGQAEDKDAEKAAARDARGEEAGQGAGEKSNNGFGDERGNGHTPVTVCHATGNGGFVEITFDENAFDKHLENHMKHMDDHQDYVVQEGAGCEDVAPATTQDEVVTTDDTDDTDVVADAVTLTETRETVDAEILGVERFVARTRTGVEAPAVLGAEGTVAGAAAGASAVPAAGPVAGILPQTGAAPMALAAAAGLGLVGAGATMVARRRREV
jgi:LPXTG-motif cell wall-anchored protein